MKTKYFHVNLQLFASVFHSSVADDSSFLGYCVISVDEQLLTLQVSVYQLTQHKIPDDLSLKSFCNLSLTC